MPARITEGYLVKNWALRLRTFTDSNGMIRESNNIFSH
jgi:hypothetical protein